MKTVDEFLRETLVNWALEDIENPVKKDALLRMRQENWREELYAETSNKDMIQLATPKAAYSKPQEIEIEIEEWYKNLLKEIHTEMKKEYIDNFPVTKWGMKRINTTGAYQFGPLNAWNEIFTKFEIGYKNGIIFWDVKNYRGKVNPKHFDKFPTIIANICKKHGYDFLVRKSSKGFGIMRKTGDRSKTLYNLFSAIQNIHPKSGEENTRRIYTIGNDAHGNLFLFYKKKKILRLIPADVQDGVQILIKEMDNPVTRLILKNENDTKELKKLVYSKI